jgi:hypothetical protein
MTRSQADGRFDFCQVMVESYAVNERMNQIILTLADLRCGEVAICHHRRTTRTFWRKVDRES